MAKVRPSTEHASTEPRTTLTALLNAQNAQDAQGVRPAYVPRTVPRQMGPGARRGLNLKIMSASGLSVPRSLAFWPHDGDGHTYFEVRCRCLVLVVIPALGDADLIHDELVDQPVLVGDPP